MTPARNPPASAVGRLKYAYRYHAESPSRGMEYLQLEHDRCVDLWDELVDIDDAIERRIEASACAHNLDTHFADTGDEQTGVWQRRKVAKLERSQTEASGIL